MKLLSGLLTIFLFSGVSCFGGMKARQSRGIEATVKTESQEDAIHWMDYDSAKKEASARGKYIALFFTGSDWCSWCFRMQKEILSTKEFSTYANEHFCMVEVDFPRKNPLPQYQQEANEQLLHQYKVKGFPTLVILNAKEEVVLKEGFRYGGGEEYVSYLRGLLK